MKTHFGRLTILVLALATCANAGIIHVPADQPSIQAGIDAAATGDTVLVVAGVYYENINFHGKTITVTSEQGSGLTIIDGQALDSVATFISGEGKDAVLAGFTLQNGRSGFDTPGFGNGGGIRIGNASPTIQNNLITSNRACSGVGISVSGVSPSIPGGSPLIQGNTISNNAQFGCGGGTGGGGIGLIFSGAAQIRNNIVENNFTGADGGGISLFSSGTAVVSSNIIRHNSSSTCGGGIALQSSGGLVINNLITGNSAGCGGGIYWLGTGLSLINNTIPNNYSLQGSGIYFGGSSSQAQWINDIVVAPSGQYAVYCNLFATNPPLFNFSDVFSNPAFAYGGSCANQTGLNGNISLDPLFFDPGNGDFRLSVASPAIDSGTSDNAPAVDLEGNPRPIDGNNDGSAAFDMGAFEAPQITITLADLTATKIDSVGGSVIFPNQWTWSIAVTNHGGLPTTFAQGQVILRDNLPASGATYGPPSISAIRALSGAGMPNCTISFSDLMCTAVDGNVTINPGGTFMVQLVAVPSGSGSFANPRGGGTCAVDPDGAIAEANEANNQCADTVIVPGADVQLTKVITAGVSNGFASAGSNVTYLLTVTNNGPSTATNIVVKDVIPANTTFVSCVPSSGSCLNQVNTVNATIASLANGAQATVTIVLTVASGAPSGTLISNIATVSTSPADPNPVNNTTPPAYFTVGLPADLHLTKVISAGVSGGGVPAGSNVTYLITVSNNGPNVASNVQVTDSLPVGTSFVSCTVSVGNCFLNYPAVNANLGLVTNGSQATLTIVANVGFGVAGGTVINNIAAATASNPDPNPSDNQGNVAFTVQPPLSTDLQLTNVISSGTVGGISRAGSNVTYLITVSNNGANAASNVVINDTLPSNAAYVSCAVSVGTCGFDHVGAFSASIGSLPSGAQATLTIVISLGCDLANGAAVGNFASVTSPNPDPNPGNNYATVTFVVRPPSPVVNASVPQNVLTQNNHELVNVGLAATATYNACPASTSFTVQVFGNEDDQTPTAKNEVYSPDSANIALGNLRLRAERVDTGNGRVYLIVVTGTSSAGSTGFGTATVTVPKSASAASVASVLSQAAAAASYASGNGGAPPASFFVIGDGPVIGPKQ